MRIEMEEVELRAEPAVVALARLLEALEVGVEIRLRVERRPVDPRQLLVVLVAAPVRARESGQLHGLDRLGVLQMRATAEIREVALRIDGDRAFRRVDELHLVRLVLLEEALLRLRRGYLLTLPLASLAELAVDLLLDPRQVLLAPVRADEDRLLGELRADGLRSVEPRRAVGKFEFRVVGKDDLHGNAGYGALRARGSGSATSAASRW